MNPHTKNQPFREGDRIQPPCRDDKGKGRSEAHSSRYMLDSSMENLTQLLGPPGVRSEFLAGVFVGVLGRIWFTCENHQGCPKKGTLIFFCHCVPTKTKINTDKYQILCANIQFWGINKMDIVLLLFLFLN